MLKPGLLLAVGLLVTGLDGAHLTWKTDCDYYPERDEPCTRTKQGEICGEVIKTRSGRGVASFRGIPYAKPPVGPLRFKDPVAVDPWENTLNATADAPMCMQKNYLLENPHVEGQEDCLYLNVYTPEIPTINKNVKTRYPVMFYIHGGGWFSGTGASFLHGPEYFLDEDVILVTINYRLGVLGFLSTSDDEAVGNWALKDMTLALQWVQDNIQYFGGNKESVTIFGQSAGGGSVHYLMLSPRTKGLFHKVIAQSGSALNTWAYPINSIDIARAQASFVNCSPNATTAALVQCLRQVDASTLIDTGDKFKFWSVDPITIYIPTVEKKTSRNPDPFVPDLPVNLVNKGQYNAVPLMIGVMQNEGIIRAAPIITHKTLREDLNARWNEIGPLIFYLPLSLPQNQSLVPEIWKKMTDFYMKGNAFINQTDNESIEGFMNLYTDRAITYGVYQSIKKHAKLGLHPVYAYKINYAGRDTWSNVFIAGGEPINFVFNKSHCDDLNYLFNIPAVFPEPFPKNSSDYELSKKLVRMWTNFATEGKPAKFWKNVPQGKGKFNYLEITSPVQMSMKTDFFTDRLQFWEKLPLKENR